MKISTLAILFAVASAPLHADLVLVQKAESESTPVGGIQTIIKLRGDKLRLEATPQVSSIFDAKTGDVITLMHPQKVAMIIPGHAKKKMREQVSDEVVAELAATGRKETINGFVCQEYAGKMRGRDAVIWTTTELEALRKKYQAAVEQMSKLGGDTALLRGLTSYPARLEGFPVRSTFKTPDGHVTTTLISFKEENLPASEYEVPSGYRKMEVPVTLTAPHGGG